LNRKSPTYEELKCRLAEAEGALRVRRDLGLDKVEAAQHLRDSRAMLARTERIAHLGSWEWDIAEDRVRWSEELFRIFQRDPARGAPSFAEHPDLYVAADMGRLQQAVHRCVTDGTGYELELRAVRGDGEIRHCVARGMAEKDADGKIQRLVGTMQDITERKLATEILRKRENQLQKIFEILPIGLWFVDKEGTLLRGNPMGILIWGAEPTVPISEYGVFKAWRLPERKPVEPEDWALTKTIRHGVTVMDELLEIETFDGKRKTILNYTAPVLDGQGNIDGAIVVNLDITDRKNLEDQLRQAQKMESVGRLAGGVAHDYNNMLGVILGHTELAMEKAAPDDPVHDDLKEIFKAARRSADITRQLLTFARKQAISPRVLDLNRTVGGMLTMLQRLIGENIDLVWRPGAGVRPVRMDPSQIDQVLANLCINARDAIGGVGRLTIEMETRTFDESDCADSAECIPGDFVLLTVRDDGCGMDPQTLDNLFEPFFTTKPVGKGTGLGLATVYGIIKQNRGFVQVESEPGQGTTFRIYLPAHVSAETRPENGPGAPQPGSGESETILLVEDEPAILKMTTLMLERLGYVILAAETPAKAIDLAREHAGEVHLLMTDVVMPEMNGGELAKRLGKLYPNLKYLFMSGYTDDVIAEHGILGEGVHFLQKPFSRKGLGDKVRRALDGE
jgi:two-component system, cell cycle sensor histidine kinase and response regulator CckA